MPRVLHVITSLDADGAQTLLMDFASRCPEYRYRNLVAFLVGKGALTAEPRYAGVAVADLTRAGAFDFRSLFRLVGLMRSQRIDLVHTHLVHGGIMGRIAARLAGVRRVVTTRHYGTEEKERSLLYRLEDRMTRRNDRVIAISQAVRQHLADRRIARPERVRVVHNALDQHLFGNDPPPPRSGPGRPPVLGSIGRLRPQKGFSHLLDAVRLVRAEHPGTTLEIVGDGPLRRDLECRCRELDLADAVRFLGAVPHSRIPQRIDGWDLFVLSSVWEGFGMVLIEAMARARAVVATRVEGVMEVVEEGVTGLLVPPSDAPALAAAVNELLRDTERRSAMGRAGRERALRLFSMERFVEQTIAVYDELLGEGS
jgi:glycosyltransferase involved in cell wall biosynthesis